MFEDEAAAMGFVNAACGPMVRSSYHADRQAADAGARLERLTDLARSFPRWSLAAATLPRRRERHLSLRVRRRGDLPAKSRARRTSVGERARTCRPRFPGAQTWTERNRLFQREAELYKRLEARRDREVQERCCAMRRPSARSSASGSSSPPCRRSSSISSPYPYRLRAYRPRVSTAPSYGIR